MSGYSTVLDALEAYSDNVALEAEGLSLRYADVQREVKSLAQNLNGVQAVAIAMQNSIPWIITDLACIQAGVPCVPLPPFFTAGQREYAMRDAGVSLVMTDQPELFNGTVETITIAGQPISLVSQFYPGVQLPPHTAKITYTSGTTGTPKGVCLTQEAMELVARSLLAALGADIAKRHVSLLPLAILLENVAGIYTSLLAGATCCLPQVRHEPQSLGQAITQTNATSCILVPELLRMLMAANTPLPSLKFAAVGGACVDPSFLEAAHAQGIPAYEGYGISENASVITVNTPTAYKHGTAGKALPHIDLRIDDSGEIQIKHPLFSGYLGDNVSAQEWYATGDLGALDEDGFLRIHGRKRNVFITSYGRNVSPEWPESLLISHPAIAQAAVFGEARPFATAVIMAYDPSRIESAISEVNAGLPDYARIGAYVLATHPFGQSNGQLTGNGRLKRDAIGHAYAHHINACYTAKENCA